MPQLTTCSNSNCHSYTPRCTASQPAFQALSSNFTKALHCTVVEFELHRDHQIHYSQIVNLYSSIAHQPFSLILRTTSLTHLTLLWVPALLELYLRRPLYKTDFLRSFLLMYSFCLRPIHEHNHPYDSLSSTGPLFWLSALASPFNRFATGSSMCTLLAPAVQHLFLSFDSLYSCLLVNTCTCSCTTSTEPRSSLVLPLRPHFATLDGEYDYV